MNVANGYRGLGVGAKLAVVVAIVATPVLAFALLIEILFKDF